MHWRKPKVRGMLEEIDRELGSAGRWWIASVCGLLITCAILVLLGMANG